MWRSCVFLSKKFVTCCLAWSKAMSFPLPTRNVCRLSNHPGALLTREPMTILSKTGSTILISLFSHARFFIAHYYTEDECKHSIPMNKKAVNQNPRAEETVLSLAVGAKLL